MDDVFQLSINDDLAPIPLSLGDFVPWNGNIQQISSCRRRLQGLQYVREELSDGSNAKPPVLCRPLNSAASAFPAACRGVSERMMKDDVP
jgi:hypothetical protein